MPTLIFVYNADGGAMNWLLDVGHKLLSPDSYSCQLCRLSHGYLTAHAPWKSFVAELEADYHVAFLHRDEYLAEAALPHYPTPTILIKDDAGTRQLMGEEDIQACDSLEILLSRLRQRLAEQDPSTRQ